MEVLQFVMFMIWDGMAFFSTGGYHKLKRMKDPSIKPRFYDKYMTPNSVLFGFLYSIAVVLVIVFEVSKYGTVLSTKVDLETKNAFEYDMNTGLPVMHSIYIHFSQLA